ncbi:MAG: hypothetical protein U0359_30525 [Byssovorax sp.]
MNEYTRREEVRWTLIGAIALVVCMAPAVLLLVLAQGKIIPDPAAARAAEEASTRVATIRPCVSAAEKLVTEIDVFKSSAKAARLETTEPADPGGPSVKVVRPIYVKGKLVMPTKEKEVDAALAWSAAQPSQKLAKSLVPCKVTLDGAVGARPDAGPAWEAVNKAAEVPAPSADPKEQINAARALLKLFDTAPIAKIVQQAKDAEADAKKAADAAQAKAETATVREAIPEGVIPRRLAVGLGVGLSVITLLLSYLSVRIVSIRRLTTLVPLREAAKVSQPGVHAAAVLRLAAQHNGGQPGMVIGAALGGLIAALLQRLDTDVFIVGVMGGCIFGLTVQWAFRLAMGASHWRERATELSDVEKPTIPIVLVLSGVNPGLEGPFITFFNGLSPTDAALTVEKLAAQAEEKILAAADAGAAARQQAMMPPGMMPPGMPPG